MIPAGKPQLGMVLRHATVDRVLQTPLRLEGADASETLGQ
jgi:hypothetical protein